MNWNKILAHPQLPNAITLARLAVVPLILLLFVKFPGGGVLISAIIATVFLLAALTDLLDGYLARKYNIVSTMGTFLDPLADKLLVSVGLIMLIPLDRVPAWLVFLLLAREMAVTGLRAIAMEHGLVISASRSAKQKTLTLNIALFCLLWHYPLLWGNTDAVGMVMLYLALFLSYWSGGLYFYKFFKSYKA